MQGNNHVLELEMDWHWFVISCLWAHVVIFLVAWRRQDQCISLLNSCLKDLLGTIGMWALALIYVQHVTLGRLRFMVTHIMSWHWVECEWNWYFQPMLQVCHAGSGFKCVWYGFKLHTLYCLAFASLMKYPIVSFHELVFMMLLSWCDWLQQVCFIAGVWCDDARLIVLCDGSLFPWLNFLNALVLEDYVMSFHLVSFMTWYVILVLCGMNCFVMAL